MRVVGNEALEASRHQPGATLRTPDFTLNVMESMMRFKFSKGRSENGLYRRAKMGAGDRILAQLFTTGRQRTFSDVLPLHRILAAKQGAKVILGEGSAWVRGWGAAGASI